MKNRRRVVITGMGAVTPLSHNVEDLYKSQLEGKSGVGPIHHFDARTFPTTFASQVKNFSLSKFVPGGERWDFCGLNTRFALAAARQALDDAGLIDNPRIDPGTIGVYLGSGEGGHDFKSLVESRLAPFPITVTPPIPASFSAIRDELSTVVTSTRWRCIPRPADSRRRSICKVRT